VPRYRTISVSEENYNDLNWVRDRIEELIGIDLSMNDALSLILYYIKTKMRNDDFKFELVKLILSARAQSS
jgi:hypothetical protein